MKKDEASAHPAESKGETLFPVLKAASLAADLTFCDAAALLAADLFPASSSLAFLSPLKRE